MEDIFFLTIGPFHPKLYGFYNSASKEVCHRTPEMFFRSCAGSPVASHSSSWHLTNIPAMFVGCGLCAVGVVRSASPVLLLVVHVCDPPHIPHRLTVSGKRGSHCRALAFLEALHRSAGRSPNRSYRLAEWSNLFLSSSPSFCQEQEHVFSYKCHPVGGTLRDSEWVTSHISGLGLGWYALDHSGSPSCLFLFALSFVIYCLLLLNTVMDTWALLSLFHFILSKLGSFSFVFSCCFSCIWNQDT